MPNLNAKIKVLIVDDSAIVRRILSEQLAGDEQIEVVGTAPDPYVARDKIVHLNPDVITLDLEMPRMDGLSFLKRLMKYYPLPVIIISSYTKRGCHNALHAMEIGAVEVLSKPGSSFSVREMGSELVRKVKIAAKAKRTFTNSNIVNTNTCASDYYHKSLHPRIARKVIAIGASTGGTKALKKVLGSLPASSPGILVVQHMPALFTRTFAERLNEECAMEVKEAVDGDLVQEGRVLIAPGDYHMLLKKSGSRYVARIRSGGEVCYHRPSVEMLFRSVAKEAGSDAVGIIMTGMGSDGALGLLEMKKRGAMTIAQDEESCVIFGMPKEAIATGAVDKVVPLDSIPKEILRLI